MNETDFQWPKGIDEKLVVWKLAEGGWAQQLNHTRYRLQSSWWYAILQTDEQQH